MTIKEVLEADWTVSKISVIVRDQETSHYIMRYCIGKSVCAGRSEHFLCEVKAGDLYENSGMKSLYIDKIIQFKQLEDKPQGKEACVGVMLRAIPKEILSLVIEHMSPFDCGRSDNMHGYHFECYTHSWNGINGEFEQIETEKED